MNIDMKLANMNIKQFIDYIIKFNNIDDILDNFTTQSEKGFVFFTKAFFEKTQETLCL